MPEFRVLGPVEVSNGDGPLELRGPKQRGLLAMLLLSAGEAVSRDRLIDGLWGEAPPPRVEHALDAQVSSLRRALAPAGDGRLLRRAPGYVLRVDAGELDLERFERRLAEGRAAAAAGRHETAAATLREALALWRGAALADVLSEPFAADAARELEDRRIAAVEDRVDADLARGLGPELVGELERLVGEHPFHERLLGALAVALYRAGRHPAALEVLAAARRRFALELGLEPGPSLRELERRILGHDPSLRCAPPRAEAAMRGRLRRSLPVAGGILGAALIAGVVLSRGGSDEASAPRVAGAQVLTIDAASDRPRQAVRIPVPPSAIAADPTGVWLTDPDDNLLARVDRGSGEITARLAMPSAPGAIAVGDGAVWVASSVSGAVSRVDPVTARTTQTIRLHGHASTVAYGAGRVWVADENGRTLTRLHPATGRPERTTTLDDRPTAITVAFGLVWVASQAADTVTALDPRTMARLATIGVGGAPVALAAGGGSLWVANSLDATVSRIEPGRPRVLATIAVGGEPTALAFARSSLWVASEAARTLTRISAESNAVAARIAVLARPTSLALTGSAILVGARPAGPERRGGTLRLLAGNVPITLDPAHQLALLPPQFLGLSHDGLVTYNHVGGAQGLGLVPDLALALPKPDASATLFGFRLRPGIRYSTGAPVEPSDFRRAFERIFRTRSPAVDYFSGIAGATRCLQRPRRCDLRAGVAADDTARTVTFHLSAPDPDFLYKLAALNYASPIPPGTPMRDTGLRPVPGTGPYRVAAAGRREIRFVRNPYFREWSHAAQPAGNPDEIVWRFGQDRAAQVRAVRAGSADWTFAGVPEQLATEIANRHAAQLHINDVPQTDFLQLNPRGTPFRDVRVRRAFNLALDRREIVERYGGPDQATPTCQVLPHGVRARRDYCPYTRDPRPDGVWRGPDLRRARRLVAASGTAGARVTIWSFSDGLGPDGIDRRATDVLRALGFRVRLRSGTHHDYERLPERERDAIDVIPSSWYADFPSPSTFFDTFLACRSATAGGFYCDPTLDRMMRRARAIEATDPARADAAWATVDRRAVDRAAWVPLVNPREVDFVSTRLRDYEYNPIWGFLASQASLE